MRRLNTVCVMVKSNLTMFYINIKQVNYPFKRTEGLLLVFGVLPRYLSFALILTMAGAGLRRHAARRAFALALH